MEGYKKNRIDLGFSDIAMLHYMAFDRREEKIVFGEISMGGDGSYHGYLVDDGSEIPSHYTSIVSMDCAWIAIYDDERKVFSTYCISGQKITIYRGGDYTVAIRKA